MKKWFKWLGIAVLTPLLLFIILAALLYLPPVQNWAVQKVTAIASEETGMDISIGHVNLEWPLDLGIDDFRMLHQNDSVATVTDTIADIKHLTVNVHLLPLLSKQVVIEELSIRQAKLNTNGFISDLRIKGQLQELWLQSKGIDLGEETVEVNGARLSDACLDIALSDTAAVDTTKTELKWKINADSLSISRTDITLHLPDDTLNMDFTLGRAVARKVTADLYTSVYKVGSLDLTEGKFNYEPVALSDVSIGIDSIRYSPQSTSFFIRKTALKDKSGLQITELTGGVNIDSAFNHIRLPLLTLKTPDSNIMLDTDMDFSAFDEQASGKLKLRLFAQIGKQDIFTLAGPLPQKFTEHFPNRPLIIRGSADGSMNHLNLTGIDIDLATAIHASVKGTLDNVKDLSRMRADINIEAKTKNLNFITALIDPQMSNTYRIPDGITLDGKITANGTNYAAKLTAHEANGSIKFAGNARIPLDANGAFVTNRTAYDANIDIRNLNLHHFLPKDSIHTLTAEIKASGSGTDFFSPQSRLNAEAGILRLQYGSWDLDNLTATVLLANGRGQFDIYGHNQILEGCIGADLLLDARKIEGTVSADFTKADLYQMRLVEKPLTIGTHGSLKVSSDMKDTHYVSGRLNDVYVKEASKTYNPGDVGILLKANPDTTYARMQSGDFILKLDASGSYQELMDQATVLTDSVMGQFRAKVINQPAIKALLPTVKLHLESKHDNPIANLLRATGINFKEMVLDLTTSPESGINGQGHVFSLNYDSLRLDTIRLSLIQKGDRLTYQGQIRNNKRNPQFVFNTLVDGHIHEHGALAGLRYYDDKGRMGVRVGATAEMEDGGLRFRLMPQRPTLGYKEFNLNEDNYIFLTGNKKILAKVDLIADDGTGMKIYTENQDSTMLQDLTVSLHQVDLGELTAVIPYLPRITGKLNGDYHIVQDQDEHISMASDMAVAGMTYEGAAIGNLSTELVYLQKENDAHAIEARLMLNDEEFGLLNGTYKNEGEGLIDATFDMTRMPLSLINGFVPDQIVGLDGYAEGKMTVRGTTRHPNINGEVFVDSAHLISIPYSIRMRFDNDPIRIIDSKLLLENFGLYAYNEEPLNMMGSLDFSDLEHIMLDLRIRARNLLLINAKQEAKSVAWGKAYVNFLARMQGPLDMLNVRGRLDVLGSTDLTYMLLDSPLSADNRLNELVQFADFNDSVQTVITRPTPSGLKADLTIGVSEGAHFVCDLNPEQTNYIDLTGGGDLRMKYDNEGINLTGRYTLSSGEMKYSLPIIPLKTFTIKNGSYVEFTGDPMNPRLNITATERTKATVSDDTGVGRSVAFDCGVVITKTLNDMGLQFIIDAPEDNNVNTELSAMSAEERGKIAVTMLTTGMYLADGNTSGFSMNAALSSFLQSEINNITGSALKTLDLSVGIDNTTDASGTMHTDYSFKFAKRFFDNRLRIEIGGLVSSGDNAMMGQKQSFFDNVTMEYRLNQNATQNLKLFYKQNVYDWLEGYTSMYGIGFVWRRKLDNFWDIFQFWKKEKQPTYPVRQSTGQQSQMQRDSIRTDSTNIQRDERRQ